MARILAISSFVSFGTVGLQALGPALGALGHDVIAVPTVVLSNHPGFKHTSGTALSPETLKAMLAALTANGWIEGIDAIVSGYLPSSGHVAVVRELVGTIKSSRPLVPYVCDPVIGDDPQGIYIDPAGARAIKDLLVPIADLATPNRFELAYLSDRNVTGLADVGPAIARLRTKSVLITSMPGNDPTELANVLWSEGRLAITRVLRRANAPHGTGDLFSGLVLGHLMRTGDLVRSLGAATEGVDSVLAQSNNTDRLNLVALDRMASSLPEWPIEQGNPG